MVSPAFIIAVSLADKPCLVVGSGPEAELRVRRLTECGARVTAKPDFADNDLDDQWLAVLADQNAELAARMDRATRERRMLFCAIDQPAYGNFAHLALARAGDLSIAISTAGRAPALARRLRDELQRVLDAAHMAEFVDRIAQLRASIEPKRRRATLERALSRLRFAGQLELPSPTPED